MMKKYKINTNSILFLILLFLGIENLSAQETINVTVRGKMGELLSDASIIADGNIRQTSDMNGSYDIENLSSNTITVEHIDYKSKTVKVGENKKIEVILEPVFYKKDVPLAFGTVRFDSFTGAVSFTTGEEIKNVPTQTLANNLSGKIAGLTVMQSSGEPGSDIPDLFIRGKSTYNNSNVLVLVDGFEGDYNQLLPDEIESVTILKDAAALSIYGIRGSNGVMLVKTKRGVKSDRIDIRLNMRSGISSPISKPKFVDAFTYASLYNEALSNDNGIWSPRYMEEELNAYKDGSAPYFYPNIDWYKETLEDNVPYGDINLSFKGGNENVKYYLMLGYINSQKFYKMNPDRSFSQLRNLGKTDKYNVRANVDMKINTVFSLAANIGSVILNRKYPNGGSFWGILYSTPANAFPIKNKNGTWAASPVYTNNPLGNLVMQGKRSTNERTIQSDVIFKQDLSSIIPGLKLSEGIAFTSWSLSNYDIWRDYERWYVPKNNGEESEPILAAGAKSEFSIDQNTRSQWSRLEYQGMADYAAKLGDIHDLHAVFGAMYSRYDMNGVNVPYLNAGLFGRLGYGYDNRYFTEFGFAYNGSENLPRGNKFGFFPSLSAAWVLSNEDFLSNNSAIDFLKLRASAGMFGSADLGSTRFGYQTYYTDSERSYQLGSTANVSITGIMQGRLGNPNISYEKNYKYNIGLDFGLMKKIEGSVDFFAEKRKGILVVQTPQVPSIVGLILPYENLGEVSNKGFEFELLYTEKISDFGLSVGGNLAYAKNTIDYQAEVFRKNAFSERTGHPVGSLFGLEAIGFFQSEEEINDAPLHTFAQVQPGDIRYKDQDGDNIIDENDVVYLGYSNLPELTYGATLSLTYKGFDFNVFLFGQAKRNIMLNNSHNAYAFYNNGQALETSLGRWAYYPERGIDTREGATYPRLTASDNQNNYRNSSFWMKNNSFVRLRNVELGYSIPRTVTDKLNLNGIRIYLSGTNLLTITPLEDYDPQVLTGYPLAKSYNIGVNLQF